MKARAPSARLTVPRAIRNALIEAMAWQHLLAEQAGISSIAAINAMTRATRYREILEKNYAFADEQEVRARVLAEKKAILPEARMAAADRAERSAERRAGR